MAFEKQYGKPGEKYGKLTVIGESEKKGGKRYVHCVCECGNETVVRLTHIRSGTTVGCGCGVGRPKHRMTGSQEYKSWSHIKSRCLNTEDPAYKNYGGRGIKVHEEWIDDFQKFFEHVGPKPGPGYSVDRIDNDKGYVPGNVRWATQLEQCRNTRQNRMIEFEGKIQSLGAWADELMMSDRTLHTRLSRGWSIRQALTTPVTKKRSRRGAVAAFGRKQSLPQWGKETGIKFKTIAARLSRGWSVEDALTLPPEVGSNQTLRNK